MEHTNAILQQRSVGIVIAALPIQLLRVEYGVAYCLAGPMREAQGSTDLKKGSATEMYQQFKISKLKQK